MHSLNDERFGRPARSRLLFAVRHVAMAAGAAIVVTSATAAAQARAELEVRSVSGPLTQSAASVAMRDAGNAVQRCLLRLERGSAISFGPRAFVLDVDTAGGATARDALSGASGTVTLNATEAQLRACMRAALSRVRFPAAPDGASVLSVTVRLSSG